MGTGCVCRFSVGTRPKGDCLEGKGVSPDVLVEVDPCQLNAGVDQQMNKAIEILSGMGGSDRAAMPRV